MGIYCLRSLTDSEACIHACEDLHVEVMSHWHALQVDNQDLHIRTKPITPQYLENLYNIPLLLGQENL